MQMLSCPVATYCVGQAASGAAVLLLVRKVSVIACPIRRDVHQPHGGVSRSNLGHRDPGKRDLAFATKA